MANGGIIESSVRRFNPQQGQNSNPNDVTTIILPATDFLDVSNSYLELYHAGTGTGVALATSANDLIYKVDVRSGDGTLLSSAEHQNMFNRAISNYAIDSSAKAGSLQVSSGYGILAERQGFAAGRSYALSLQKLSPFFRSANKYLPLSAMQGISIEITWASSTTAQIVTTGTSNYAVSSVGLMADLVRFDDVTTSALLKYWVDKGIRLSSVSHQYIPITDSSQLAVLNLNVQKKVIRTLYVFPRMVTTINDPTADSFATTTHSLKQVSVTCGDTVGPLLRNGSSMFLELMKAFDFQVSGSVNWATWQTSAFCLAFDMEALSSVVSGFNSSVINQVISLQIEYSSALPGTTRYDCIIEYDSVIDIRPEGVMVHA